MIAHVTNLLQQPAFYQTSNKEVRRTTYATPLAVHWHLCSSRVTFLVTPELSDITPRPGFDARPAGWTSAQCASDQPADPAAFLRVTEMGQERGRCRCDKSAIAVWHIAIALMHATPYIIGLYPEAVFSALIAVSLL